MNKEVADIVSFLRTDESSPYFGILSIPYSKNTKFSKYKKISQQVKQCIEKLHFYRVPVDMRKLVFLNYLLAVMDNYEGDWYGNNNPLRNDYGFVVLILVFKLLIKEASIKKDFSRKGFSSFFIKKISFDFEYIKLLTSFGLKGCITNEFLRTINPDLIKITKAKH